jgi:hypothetical protein
VTNLQTSKSCSRCFRTSHLEQLFEVCKFVIKVPHPQPRSTAILPCPNRTGVLPAGIPAVTLAAVRSRRHCAWGAAQQRHGVTGALWGRWADQLLAPSPLARRSHPLTPRAGCQGPLALQIGHGAMPRRPG